MYNILIRSKSKCIVKGENMKLSRLALLDYCENKLRDKGPCFPCVHLAHIIYILSNLSDAAYEELDNAADIMDLDSAILTDINIDVDADIKAQDYYKKAALNYNKDQVLYRGKINNGSGAILDKCSRDYLDKWFKDLSYINHI